MSIFILWNDATFSESGNLHHHLRVIIKKRIEFFFLCIFWPIFKLQQWDTSPSLISHIIIYLQNQKRPCYFILINLMGLSLIISPCHTHNHNNSKIQLFFPCFYVTVQLIAPQPPNLSPFLLLIPFSFDSITLLRVPDSTQWSQIQIFFF